MDDNDKYWEHEAAVQKLRANREESQKNTWLLAAALSGLFLVLSVYSSFTRERGAVWLVDYAKPVVILETFPNWWSGAQSNSYAWGKASDGREGWLPVFKDGKLSTDSDDILEEPGP